MLLSKLFITFSLCFTIGSCDKIPATVDCYCQHTSTVNIDEFTPAEKSNENIALDLGGQKIIIGDCVYLEFDIQVNKKVNIWYEKVFTIIGDISEQWPFPGFQVNCQRGSFRFYYMTTVTVLAYESPFDLIDCDNDHSIHHIQFFIASSKPIFTFDGKIYRNYHAQASDNLGHPRFDENVQIYSTLYYDPHDPLHHGDPIHGQTPRGVLDGVVSNFEYISINEPCPCEDNPINPSWESCNDLAKDKFSKQLDNYKNGPNQVQKGDSSPFYIRIDNGVLYLIGSLFCLTVITSIINCYCIRLRNISKNGRNKPDDYQMDTDTDHMM